MSVENAGRSEPSPQDDSPLPGSWSQAVEEGRFVDVERTDQPETADWYQYSITVPGADTSTVNVIDPVARPAVALVSATEGPEYRCRVRIEPGAGLVRLPLRIDGTTCGIFLPGPSFARTCARAMSGESEAIESLLDAVVSPVELLCKCGAFLDLDQVIDLVAAVTTTDRYVSTVIHTHRYDILRGAIVSPVGLSVSDATDLHELVEGFDSLEQIGDISVAEVLGDAMATACDDVAATDALLADLGFERTELMREQDGRLFACYLGLVVLNEGVSAARSRAAKREWWLEGDYHSRKATAQNAAYGQRGERWRRLLCQAARRSQHEFTTVLANALHWSGREQKTDSRMDELMQAAAEKAAAAIDNDALEARAEFERHTAAGHRLRSKHRYVVSLARFDQAKAVAATARFLPEWKPIYNRAVVRTSQCIERGAIEEGIGIIDEAVSEVLDRTTKPGPCNHVVRHLTAKKRELQALQAKAHGNTAEIISALWEAHRFYTHLGFDRSVDRIQRKLADARTSRGRAIGEHPQ